MRTWHVEAAAVGGALVAVTLATRGGAKEWLATAAVVLSFLHANVASRMAEREEAKPVPDVECFRWLHRYWVAKEVLWAVVFACSGLWPALVGCFVFAVHPFWRRAYRARYPLGRAE